MKNSNYTMVLKNVSVVIAMMFLLGTTLVAQKASNGKASLNEFAIKNLIQGISHENDGVRKASIYYAGKFMVEQTVDALIEQLKNEKYPSYRQSIILSLYIIGNEKGLDAINNAAFTDPDLEVKRMCYAIHFVIEDNKTMIALSNKNK